MRGKIRFSFSLYHKNEKAATLFCMRRAAIYCVANKTRAQYLVVFKKHEKKSKKSQKNLKNFEKTVDFRIYMWYYKQAVHEGGAQKTL